MMGERSMVASGTGFLGIDHEFFFEFQAELLGGLDSCLAKVRIILKVNFRIVGEIIDFLQWTEIFLRSAVTFQAPAHRVGLCLVNHLHFIHITVAALAGNPAVDVCGVVEIDIVR